MGEYNIKVAAPWHDQLKVWIPFSMFAFLLISMGIRAGYLVQSVGMVVPLFLLSFFASLTTALFRVQVNGQTIRVRTSFGKWYEIKCGDIGRVECTTIYSEKYGPQFRITVATQQRKFTLNSDMAGFDTMAGYILAQLEKGKIRYTAVSKSCAEQLQKFQDGSFKRKKKKEGN